MFVHLPKVKFIEPTAKTFKSGDRYYTTPNGKRYPSITTILKLHSQEAIQSWRKRVGASEANKVGARAGGRGTRIHSLMEKTLRNELVDPNLIDLEMYRAMLKHANRINNIRLMETALYSDTLAIGGRCDCVAEFDKELSIIDFKSSLRKKKVAWVEGYCMQVTGYALMYEERFGISIKKGVIIMGVDNDKAQVFHVNIEDWMPMLVEYRELWRKLYGN